MSEKKWSVRHMTTGGRVTDQGNKNQEYLNSHKEANKIDPRHKENYNGYNTSNGTMLQRIDNPEKKMLLPYPKKKK
jgi:hypothetical protein